LPAKLCDASLGGTFDVEGGCYYFCDRSFRQSFNVSFYEDMTGDGSKECGYDKRCDFDGVKLRPGDQVEAYNVERAGVEGCNAHKQTITCSGTGTFNFPAYKHSYCMPYD
jgi:hypothetical protein